MHPAVCEPVSRLSYDGRLRSDEHVTAARCLDGSPPGVRVLTVDHDGNSTEQPRGGRRDRRRDPAVCWARSGPTSTAPVRCARTTYWWSRPYNAQVVLLRERLDAAGLSDVDVGTVDKFQGRQAPVVFVSMTASSIDDVPRGISFLLNRNRLNVAVSRAKYASRHRPIESTDRVPAVHARPA